MYNSVYFRNDPGHDPQRIPEASAIALQPDLALVPAVTQSQAIAVPIEPSPEPRIHPSTMTRFDVLASEHSSRAHRFHSMNETTIPLAVAVAEVHTYDGYNGNDDNRRGAGGIALSHISTHATGIPFSFTPTVNNNLSSNSSCTTYNNNNNYPWSPGTAQLSLSDRTVHHQAPYVANPLPSSRLNLQQQQQQQQGSATNTNNYVRPGSRMTPYI
jgi:hypothetical protein